MDTEDIRFLLSELSKMKHRVEALERFVRGEKGDECPECQGGSLYTVGTERTRPGGFGAIGQEMTIRRCAECGHEDVA